MNLFEQLEEIMKPYYEKQEEIKNVKISRDTEEKRVYDEAQSKKAEKELELNILRARVDKLADNKEKEINKYIEQIYITNPNASEFYVSKIKNELQQEYLNKEKELMAQIENIKNEIDNEQPMLEDLVKVYEKPDYTRVYQKELLDINDELRKQLYQFKNQVELQIRQEKINFDTVMLELSKFKYEYDENRNVINGADWKAIYDKSNVIADKIDELRKILDKITEYSKLVAAEGITYIPLSSLAPFEIAEYERRKTLKEGKIEEEIIEKEEITPEEEPKFEEEMKFEDIYTKTPEDLIDSYTPVKASYEVIDDKTIVDSYEDLIKMVYNDVIKEAENMRSIKLDPIEGESEFANTNYYFSEKLDKDGKYMYKGNVDLANDREVRLPNGEYLNESDFYQALKKYTEKNKGKTFTVKKRFLNQKYNIDEKSVKTIKDKFKECSIVKLLTTNSIFDIDVRRVFGKEKAEAYKSKASHIGRLTTKLPAGDYVSRNEMIAKLDDVFVKQNKKWLKNLVGKMKRLKDEYLTNKKNNENLEEDYNDEYTVDFDENISLKRK